MLSERGRRWVVFAGALLLALLTARLGLWQLDRAAQKVGLRDAIAQRAQQPPLAERELALDTAALEPQLHRTVRLRGYWLAERTVYLDNRQMDAQVGFFVLTPLKLAGSGDAIVVQRGWLPRDARDRTRIAPYATPPGEVEILARIAPAPSRLFDFGAAEHGPIRQNLDLAAYARETGLPLRPFSLLQLGEAGDGLRREWPLPAFDVQKHYGYAAQWFGMSALITGLYVWFQLLRPRRRRAD